MALKYIEFLYGQQEGLSARDAALEVCLKTARLVGLGPPETTR